MISASAFRMLWINPHHFWTWFQEHQEKFKYPSRLPGDQVIYWEKEMYGELMRYGFLNLFADITVDEPNNWARLVISAYGNKKYFESVEMLIEAAPKMEGWEFVALYPLWRQVLPSCIIIRRWPLRPGISGFHHYKWRQLRECITLNCIRTKRRLLTGR